MAKSKWLIPFLVLAGFFFMALSWWMSARLESRSPGLKPLARILYNSGEVFILPKNMTVKETLLKSKTLYHLDTIETGPNGDALLEVDTHYRLRILDNTLITVDQDSDKTVLILKRGDVQFENFGSNPSLLISKGGQRYTPSEYVSLLEQEGSNRIYSELAPQVNESPATQASSNGLSSEQIQDTLKRQIPAFDRCYKQLLQRTPGLSGEIVLSFIIERSGKISDSQVSTSTISDTNFKRCLTEVVRRIEFKSFAGDPITSTFPMRFE